METVLIVGSGGRESALYWALTSGSSPRHVWVAPGNAGTHPDNVALNPSDPEEVADWAARNSVDLVVCGPEAPLALGLADRLEERGVLCFGPSQRALRVESSKAYARSLMERAGVPCAVGGSFRGVDEALAYLDANPKALVVKASGLAGGKGVVVNASLDEARECVRWMFRERPFGDACDEVVLEEVLVGREVSVFALCDGEETRVWPASCDYKRAYEGGRGPNTGGMGAYAPAVGVTEGDLLEVERRIFRPMLKALADDGAPYRGVLYAGLMWTSEGPKVLEFNGRFGDPETQVLLPLLRSDLYPYLRACACGRLGSLAPLVWREGFAVAVVMASAGYPFGVEKGFEVRGVEGLDGGGDVRVFHAGVRRDGEGRFWTSGGRVLSVSARAGTLRGAIDAAYEGASKISFEGGWMRRDIGVDLRREAGEEG